MPSIPETLAAGLTPREREALRRFYRPQGKGMPPEPAVLTSLIRLRLIDADLGTCLPVVTPLGREVLTALDRAARKGIKR